MVPRATHVPPAGLPGCMMRLRATLGAIPTPDGVNAAVLIEVYPDDTDLMADRDRESIAPADRDSMTYGCWFSEPLKWPHRRHLNWFGRRAYQRERAHGKGPLAAYDRVRRIGRPGQRVWNAAQGTIRLLESRGPGTAAHEALHALCCFRNWYYLSDPAKSHEDEEKWCYALGDLTEAGVEALRLAQEVKTGERKYE